MRKILAIVSALLMTLSLTAQAFSDVVPGAWYEDAVQVMTEQGILQGYDDGTFKPDGTITYAEFTAIISRCANGPAESSISGHWAKAAMEYAYQNRWYDYDEINEGLYDQPIPRYMAVKVLDLGLKIPGNEQENNAYWKYMNEIKDFNSIDGRYAYLVVRAYNNGILTGDENGNFNAKSNLTRAEACAIIARALGKSTVTVPEATADPAVSAPQTVRAGGVSENGTLHVSGTQLTNEHGEPVVLHGMSSHGLHWFPQFTTREWIAKTADSGANLFRAAMYTGEGGYISQPEKVKNLLITAVDNAISEDMYVIIDWHILSDGNPMTYVEQSKEFFNEISARYKDSPNVLYEICNEPNGGVSWEGDVKPYAESVIPVIRANDADSVILVGSPTWSQDIDKAADDPLDYDNIMYTCHFYAGTHGQWLRDRVDYALSKGAPIFISEWGTSAADGSGGVFVDETNAWLSFLRERGISWANWSLCDKNETSAALSGSELSESGKIVFSNF